MDRVIIISKVAGIPLGADGFVVSIQMRQESNPKIPIFSINHDVLEKHTHIYVEIVFTLKQKFTSKFSYF